MKKDTPFEILFRIAVHHLHDAEREILHKLGELAENAFGEELGNLLLEHREETKQHISRLEAIMEKTHIDNGYEVFSSVEELIANSKSLLQSLVQLDFNVSNKILRGIISEGDDLLSKFSSTEAADSVVLGISEQIEYFGIASYRQLCRLASLLGEKEIENLLKISLQEEIAMERRLQHMAKNLDIHVSFE